MYSVHAQLTAQVTFMACQKEAFVYIHTHENKRARDNYWMTEGHWSVSKMLL